MKHILILVSFVVMVLLWMIVIPILTMLSIPQHDASMSNSSGWARGGYSAK